MSKIEPFAVIGFFACIGYSILTIIVFANWIKQYFENKNKIKKLRNNKNGTL